MLPLVARFLTDCPLVYVALVADALFDQPWNVQPVSVNPLDVNALLTSYVWLELAVEPETLPRSEGKAVRVIDERNFE